MTVLTKEKKPAVEFNLRSGKQEDAEALGIICYRAFKTIADAHNFPPDFPSPEMATELFRYLLVNHTVYSVVAEIDGSPAGSNFLWESGPIMGIGPITIDPAIQNLSVGRKLMDAVLNRAEQKQAASVRLVQAAYHNRSLSLYTKLGFDAKEPLSLMQGPALNIEIPGHQVRKAEVGDIKACNQLAFSIHGHHRHHELMEAVNSGNASVVETNGVITAYTTGIGFFGHSVSATNSGLKSLIGAAPNFCGPGFLVPTRNSELFKWCLNQGLKIVQPLTLMSIGLYNEPKGSFLPSILY